MMQAGATQTAEEEEPPPKEEVKVVPLYGTKEWIQHRSEFEGHLPSPIDVSITDSIAYWCPELKWYNFDVYPHKEYKSCPCYDIMMQVHKMDLPISSSGHYWFNNQKVDPGGAWRQNPQETISELFLIGAKWKTERPYLEGGPFLDKHVLSQIHFHWGAHMMEGSDHTVDKLRHPGEMQVTFFRSEYMNQEEALKHPNGVVMVCYLIKYGVNPDERLQWVIEGFPRIREAQTCTRIGPLPMSHLLPMFFEDYFLYWGKLDTVKGDSFVIRWLVPRITLFASMEQMKEFRKLWDPWDEPNLRNFRPLQQRGERHIFFISPHWCQYNSLLPIPRVPEPSISVLSPAYQANLWMLPPQNAYMLPKEEEEPPENPEKTE